MSPLYIVAEGDSLTAGTAWNTAGNEWPRQLARLYTDNRMVAVSNMATGGQNIPNTATNAELQIDAQFDARKGVNVLVYWTGINDLRTGPYTAAQAYANLESYCAARRAVGFKVLACTLTPCTISGTVESYEGARQTFNASIRAAGSALCDGIVDFGADPNIGPEGADADTTYYAADNCHFTDAGLLYIAKLIRAKVDAFA